MVRLFQALLAAGLLAAAGCSGFNPPPRPATVSHLDIPQKQVYIRNTRSALKTFQATAADLRIRHNRHARQELADEVERFIELRVDPIVDDFEAGRHPQTRLEIAELQLLCGLVYLELEEYRDAWQLLKEMKSRYGDQPALLSTGIDRMEYGYGNLGDGMRGLRERLIRESRGLPPLPPT